MINEKAWCRLVLKNEHVTPELIFDFLKESPQPNIVKFHMDSFKNSRKLKMDLDQFKNLFKVHWHSASAYSFITLYDKQDNAPILIGKGSIYACIIVNIYEYSGDIDIWLNYIQQLFDTSSVWLGACIYPQNDYFWQQNLDPYYWEKANKSLEGLVLKPFNAVKYLIDPASLPGHAYYVDHIWFGATWVMVFNEIYFKVIPKEQLLSFTKAYEVKPLRSGAIWIQLFEDIHDYDTEYARSLQWEFRDFINLDHVRKIMDKLVTP